MENLNAEQIKKAMKCCNSEGHICGKCPYESVRIGISCRDKLIRDALSLINQLTEDVERVRKQCGEIIVKCDERDAERLKHVAELTRKCASLQADVAKEFTCVFGTPHKVSECPINDEIAKSKAETLENIKIQFAIRYGTYTDKDMTPITEVFRLLDQIAKEMLEGEK